ncbi:MAG: saccharopine dehydrogenase NADP-binding domain-containing protein [Candidatus Gracilibacteria bacterium]|nr:saccharopine dehydrogenase NADP-binding domain-containing protein [Candidatus Gracilibacteria bacterium]
MKKVLVLGGYGNIGQVVVKDLLNSNFFVGIGGRSREKIDSFTSKLNSSNIEKVVIDMKDEGNLIEVFKKYDLVVNCLEYTFNQLILDLCIKCGKNYVDLGDDYNGIKISRSKDGLAKEAGISVCLGAGSAPGIVNVLTKYAAKSMQKIDTITISFADEIIDAPEEMLPFNFTTVVEEILGDALLFENGKYLFTGGSSRKIDGDFCKGGVNKSCFLPKSYVTNHDEQFSLPEYLSEKGIKNVYFIMKHSPSVIKLVKSLNKFGFLDKENKINIKGVEITSFEATNTLMSKHAPQNYYVKDKESLFIKLDEKVVKIDNDSVDGVPAGVMNTGIGCSLIAQYFINNTTTPGVFHPEEFVDDLWFIDELKKRNFKIYIDNKEI